MAPCTSLRLGRHVVPVPAIMGIVNATPDSFSDGGVAHDPAAAVDHARALVAGGAHVLDLGAESTRPGAPAVDAQQEWRRLEPVLRALLAALPDVPLTIDTRRPEVAERALALGAHGINDVGGGADADMAALARRYRVPWALMHGFPAVVHAAATNAASVVEPTALAAVFDSLVARAAIAQERGLQAEQIWLDPGLGFGKDAATSLAALGAVDALVARGFPVLIGPSRKRFLATGPHRPDRAAQDDHTGLACCLAAARGAAIFRVHAPAVAAAGIAFGRRAFVAFPGRLPSSAAI